LESERLFEFISGYLALADVFALFRPLPPIMEAIDNNLSLRVVVNRFTDFYLALV